MIEFGGAGLRVFDLRDGYHPKEAAYFNNGGGHVHSGVFHYDDTRGIMLSSATAGMTVLELQPQVIKALGLPEPTDPAYPRYRSGRPATPDQQRQRGGLAATGASPAIALAALVLVGVAVLVRRRVPGRENCQSNGSNRRCVVPDCCDVDAAAATEKDALAGRHPSSVSFVR